MEQTTPENPADGADPGERGATGGEPGAAGGEPGAAGGEPGATGGEPGAAGDGIEVVVRHAEVVATRPASRLPADRVRSALDTARRLARNPAVVASASAVGAVALREGVALARRAAVRQAATRPAQVPVVVVVNMMWFVHEHRWADSTPGHTSGTAVVRVRAD